MSAPIVAFYFDIRSPYSYLAREEVLTLGEKFAVAVEPLPYALAMEAFGTPESRSPRDMRKLKYIYADVRRSAKDRELIIRSPSKVFDPHLAHAAFLYARRVRRERTLYDRLLPAFWNRAFDIENMDQITALLGDIGANPDGFQDYLGGAANQELGGIANDAESAGVFGVPTFVFQGELFWGADRVEVLKRHLETAGLARADTPGAPIS
ncbi:DsbA family protein [Bradyrhizobium sp.]